jgi:putative ABC transport system permease protein
MKLYNIALSNLLRRKGKIFLVLLGLIIGTATIVSVNSIVEAMKDNMTKNVAEFGVNVVITPDTGGLTFSYGGIILPEIIYDTKQLKNEDITAIKAIPQKNMIRAISPKLMGLGVHGSGHNVIVIGADIPEEFLLKPWLRLIGESPVEPKPIEELETSNGKMDYEAIDLSRQELQRLNIKDNQVIIGSGISSKWNVNKGDILKISGEEFEVFGILMENGSKEDQYVFMNLLKAQKFLDRNNEVTMIEMAVDYLSGSEEALLSQISQAVPTARIASLRQETLRRDEILNRLVRFGIALSAIVILAGILVVALTMSGFVRERTREIGIFCALGFGKSHVAKMIIFEGIIISLIGGIMGYIVGTLIAQIGGPYLSGMDIVVPWRISFLAFSIILAVIIGVISSIYPAYQAANQDPVDALRFI